jgi:hypothetical protein
VLILGCSQSNEKPGTCAGGIILSSVRCLSIHFFVFRILTIVVIAVFNIFFTRAFNAHLTSPVVTVNALTPGLCSSDLARNVQSRMFNLYKAFFALTSEQGSRVVIRAAIWDKKEEELQGAYISAEKVKEPSDYVLSELGHAAQERVWVRIWFDPS